MIRSVALIASVIAALLFTGCDRQIPSLPSSSSSASTFAGSNPTAAGTATPASTSSGSAATAQPTTGTTPTTSTAPTSGSVVDSLPVGHSIHKITVGGTTRTYRVYRPATSAPSRGYPLVVMLHGGLGSAAQAERSYGWDKLADRAGFIVAYPDGLDRVWNAGTCCGTASKTGRDDVGFVTAAVSQLQTRVHIDPQRRFATGMSNGGMLSYRLACETTVFAAIAPVAGTQLVSCHGAAPTSVLHIHGADDPRVQMDGTPGDGVIKVSGPPIADVLEQWRQRDQCPAFTVVTKGRKTTSTANCPQHHTVRLIVVAGMGHTWPMPSNSGGFSATPLIWEFFRHHAAS